jgi:mRNA-degrading endonuclease RelE of RelBE toxin-antitoxin system
MRLLSDESYRELQGSLLEHPDVGDRIQGSGGLRKVRWGGEGRGKRGGVRVIYAWLQRRDLLLMLLIYGKNEQDDLTPEQLRVLKRLVEEEFDHG